MIRKWLSLLLALALLITGALQAVSAEETPGDETEALPAEDSQDGDDSEQIPMDLDEDEDGEEGETLLQVRLLTKGDEGDDVLFLQLRLESLQYYKGTADGKYGAETETAVREFQKDNENRGLQVTGVADIATQMLAASTQYRALRYNSEGEDVRELQIRLTALGYYTGQIKGKYLEGCENGIKQFQKNNGLKVTGVADALTQEALFSYGAIARYDVAEATPTPLSNDSFYVVTNDENAPIMPEEPVAYTKTLKSGMTKSKLVIQLQERMQQLGYYDGPISGNFMNKTLAAVKKIQTQNGMKATGTVDEETWNLIFNSTGIVMPNATPKPSPTPEPVPFAITVDVKNQIVSVYSMDENGEYTVPVRQMLCSTGKVGTPSPVGDWVLNGRKANWCYFPKWGDYARYWTRINSKVAFHSPIYSAVSLSALKKESYNMLGNRASHGCIRLAVPDAKWIYDNVGAGTVVSIREDLPLDKELKTALLAVKPKSADDPAIATTPEPEYSRDAVPDLKGAVLSEANKSKGEAVYWVQRRLKELGYYPTKCTGQMLNRTTQAVKDFQKDHGFGQTGKVDQKLINAMAEAEKITPTPAPMETPAP